MGRRRRRRPPTGGAVQAWPASEATTSDPTASAAAAGGRAPPQRAGQGGGRGQQAEPDADERQLAGPGIPRQVGDQPTRRGSRGLRCRPAWRPARWRDAGQGGQPGEGPEPPGRRPRPGWPGPPRRPRWPRRGGGVAPPSRRHSSAAPAAERVPAAEPAPEPADHTSVVSPRHRSPPPVSRPTWYTNEPSSVWLSSLVTRHATVGALGAAPDRGPHHPAPVDRRGVAGVDLVAVGPRRPSPPPPLSRPARRTAARPCRGRPPAADRRPARCPGGRRAPSRR